MWLGLELSRQSNNFRSYACTNLTTMPRKVQSRAVLRLPLNGHILEPTDTKEPISPLGQHLYFFFGRFPFIRNPGIAVGISSQESPRGRPIVIFQFIKFRKIEFMRDPQILFALIFLACENAFGAHRGESWDII